MNQIQNVLLFVMFFAALADSKAATFTCFQEDIVDQRTNTQTAIEEGRVAYEANQKSQGFQFDTSTDMSSAIMVTTNQKWSLKLVTAEKIEDGATIYIYKVIGDKFFQAINVRRNRTKFEKFLQATSGGQFITGRCR
jgi:hypothetical protein